MSDNEQIQSGTHTTADDQISIDSTRGSLTNLQQNFSQQQVSSMNFFMKKRFFFSIFVFQS